MSATVKVEFYPAVSTFNEASLTRIDTHSPSAGHGAGCANLGDILNMAAWDANGNIIEEVTFLGTPSEARITRAITATAEICL